MHGRAHSDEAVRRAWDRERKARQRRERRGQLVDLPPMDEREFQQHLHAAVRAGSVQAMKLWGRNACRKSAGRVVSPFDEFERRRNGQLDAG
jgi:hypothetical protein